MCKYCEKGEAICNENNRNLGIEFLSGTKLLVAYALDKKGWDIAVKCKINYCPMCRKEAGRVTKKEKQEHIEYIKLIVNKDIKFDKRKEELVLGFIFNILTNNTVMNKYKYSIYGNIEKDETIRLVDCINYVGLKLGLKEDKQ